MIRRLCWLCAGFSCAVFLAIYPLSPSILLPVGLLTLLGLPLSLLFRGKPRKRLAFVSAGLALGFLWTGFYLDTVRTPAHDLAADQPVLCTMEVTGYPGETDSGFSVSVLLRTGSFPHPKVQLYTGEDGAGLCPGDVITASVRLAPSDRISGEDFDYYDAKGIYLLGYVKGNLTVDQHPGTVSPRYWPQWFSHAIKESVQRTCPEDISGYLTALLTGDKDDLPSGLYAAFRRSGISHILAVSGLHVTFLSGLFLALFGKQSRLGALISILLVFFYAAVAGNSPSALRASAMTATLFLAQLVGREDDKPTTLSLILAILLLICPPAARSISLQLSFAAVSGIYLLTGSLASRWLKAIPRGKSLPGKLVRSILVFLASTLAVTLGALLFTAPLSALHFRSVSLAGPITNLLTLWAVSASFFLGFAAAAVGILFFPAGILLGWLAAWPARWVIWVATEISRLPYASLTLLSGYLVLWFVAAYLIFLIWFFFRKSIRPLIPIAAVALSLGAALLVNAWPAAAGSLTVTALDVGQGSSTLLFSKGHAVLVDCGGSGYPDAGDTAADYLQSMGLSHLDALILTHYHSDHANGVSQLLSRIDVGRLVLPDVTPDAPLRQEILSEASRYGCDVEFLYRYDADITFGDAALKIFIPFGDGGANEEGLSVLCTVGAYDLLITGDMNSVVEQRLLKYRTLPDLELLVVGHHGSSSSTSEELLLALKPEQAIISVGRNNSYGHPTDQTLERLGAAGCDIYRTDWMGTITLTVGAG